MLLGPVRTHLTTWAGNTDCIAKINSRGELPDSHRDWDRLRIQYCSRMDHTEHASYSTKLLTIINNKKDNGFP